MKKTNLRLKFTVLTAVLGLYLMSLDAMMLLASTELQTNLEDMEVGSDWIYDDLQQGIAQAKENGKPLFVIFR